jgi:tRNA(Ile)-lysidine synthase
MALLHASCAIARILPTPPTLLVAHANHGLRGKDSDDDEVFVQATAANLGLECVTAKLKVRDEFGKSDESIEMIARRLRHRFLVKVAREYGSQHVLLGHHANDQAELLLLRLLRGSGSDGLAGMQQTGPSPMDPSITLVRPLLAVTRNGIASWAQTAGVVYREDQSNLDPSIPRNHVRATLIPLLERDFSPQIVQILGRTAEILYAESEFVHSEALKWIADSINRPFAQLPIALQRAVLREQMWRLGHTPDFELIERISNFCISNVSF